MAENKVELIGSASPTGRIRVSLEMEMPHSAAMALLKIVRDVEAERVKQEEAARRREEARIAKAEEAARKAAAAEAAKAAKAAKDDKGEKADDASNTPQERQKS